MRHITAVFLITLASSAISQEGVESEALASASVIGQPQMTVEGEIRTVDSAGQPRLWGKGRQGVIRYGTTGVESGLCLNDSETIEAGLSNAVTSWGSAESACPAGTWVCSLEDLKDNIVCDTDRHDSDSDAISCDGSPVDFDKDNHKGWIDSPAYIQRPAMVYWELGTWGSTLSCINYPVWCCSEYQP